MDFGNAIILASIVFLAMELYDAFVNGTAAQRVKLVFLVLIAQVLVPLVAHSDFGGKQIIQGIHLDTMNAATQIIVALFIAGLAAGLNKILVKAVSRVGSSGEL